MSKLIENLFYSKLGQGLISAIGVKPPLTLKRFTGETPWVQEETLVASTPSPELAKILTQAQIRPNVFRADDESQFNSALFDATALQTTSDLSQLKTFFASISKRLSASAHIVIIGLDPAKCENVEHAAVMEALNGFTRSLAKELGRKAIGVNLLYCQGINDALATPLNFLLSYRAAYINGQPLYVNGQSGAIQDWQQPLKGKLALVTGAAQGIGAAIAKTLAAEGAKIIGLDIPPAKDALEATLAPLGGIAVATDITSETAINDIIHALDGQPLDIIVHNAGVTRDKTLARMPEHFWDMAININLAAPLSITQTLDQQGKLSDQARVICISSISGIAGNVGQTNYSASKSGVVGMIRKQAEIWAGTGKTINAIAPGFIETQMTDQIPFMTRELGRRMNSLSQGGQPEDVAQGVALFAQPGSQGLNGQVLRVCGQSLLGA
ncbi:MAG: 3-oxoacyl-ACP reductase [Gammaproteobacteria bacterium]|nr:3-oxoacyl-ACP reductase [Gammaproteobacteria bacterium]